MKHHNFSQSYFEANGYAHGDDDIPWLYTDFGAVVLCVVGIVVCIWSA